jgi:hypothetical protein
MTKKSREYIYDYEQDLINKDEQRDILFDYIDKMARVDWEFSEAFRLARPDIRTIRDSTPADAVENASIALSNTRPIWTVPPYSSDINEYIQASKLEHAITCNFDKSNTRGTGTVLFDKARSSILYNMIATRTDDLASILPKNRKSWTNLQREAWAAGRFIHRTYKPRGIHVEISDMGMVALLHVEILRAMDVYKYWELFEDSSTEGRMVAEARSRMKTYMDEKKGEGASLRSMWFCQYYFIDHNQILRHGHFAPDNSDIYTNAATGYMSGKGVAGYEDDFVFADAENEAGFINWSVRCGGTRIEDNPKYQLNPMLAQLYYSNIWETMNIIQSIVLSKPISELERAVEVQKTMDGQRLPEGDGVILARPTEDVQRLTFPQMDPNTFQIVDRLNQSIVRTTGASALGDVNAAKGSAFASLNAIIQIIMGRLDVQRRDMGLSCRDDALNTLKFVEYNRIPMLLYRQTPNQIQGNKMPIGQQLVITADDFDAYDQEIECEIRPKTPTDFQQQVLTAIQLHDKSPLPWKELLQGLGYKNVDALKQQRILEDFNDAEIQAAMGSIMRKAELKDQMDAQQAMQASQQPPQGQPPPEQPTTEMPQPGGGLSETAFGPLGNEGMQGMNPAGGGMSPANAMPGLTREAVSGQDARGRSIGGD